MSIQLLESHLIDQIAAGEVVERPSHMVKELIENSIDALATEIEVDISEGGRSIAISDNGSGIPSKELGLAVSRHATSKITEVEDLWRIGTYGFRGEALASIAAVSDFELISRTGDSLNGSRLKVSYGNKGQTEDCGASKGTRIEIKGLFNNLPARLKFLKSDAAEITAIKNQLKSLALANPKIQFRIRVSNQLAAFWSSTDSFLARAEQILEGYKLYEGQSEVDGIKCHALISAPHQTVAHSRMMWFIVNGRVIQDRSLQAAVMDAHRQFLMHGEYPVAVVHLDLPANEVDVNVSPNKTMVKFREPRTAFRAVQNSIRGIIENAPWLKTVIMGENDHKIESRPQVSTQGFTNYDFERPLRLEFPTEENNQIIKIISENLMLSSPKWDAPIKPKWADLDVIGQSHQTYIITQRASGILFIDQHAAHERVLFEKMMAHYYAKTIEVQNFLFPIIVKLSEEAATEVIKHQDRWQSLGLHLESMGPSDIAINGAPAIMREEALPKLILQLGEDLVEFGDSYQFEKRIADYIATLACHSAIRAGKSLSLSEIRALLEQMDEFPASSFCPHGRPVFVEYPLTQLERDFGRIN